MVLSLEQIVTFVRDTTARIHFVGISGTGMSAYADYRALSGGVTSGSDRGFDQGRSHDLRDAFIKRGIHIFPQDGSGVVGAAAVVVSAAIEATVPDYAAAVATGVPIISRKQWLAALYRTCETISVTGTSGKSTVTAMIFEALQGAGLNPGLIAGAELRSLRREGLSGNACAGTGPLVIEADESDKGTADYTPTIGVILNLQRDHDEPENMIPAFTAFADNSKQIIISDDPALVFLRGRAVVVGEGAVAQKQITNICTTTMGSDFDFDGHHVALPVPGVHNVHNAAMALAAGMAAGADLNKMIAALARYQGVARRFEIVGSGNGIEVVDDYAHNPAKIAAVIRTAIARSARVILYFQPTGYGPTRFLRPDLVAMFARELRVGDKLYIAPIYFVGGTAVADISSDDLIDDLAKRGRPAMLAAAKEQFIADMKKNAQAGDCICIVGGRDPTLPAFARDVAAAITGSL